MRILKNFKLDPELGLAQGKHCILSRFEDKVIKIFTAYPMNDLTEDHLKQFHWGDYPSEMRPQKKWCRLPEASVIQNICWLHNLAPRVYEIVGVELNEEKYFAQIQDEETGEHPLKEEKEIFEGIYEEVKNLGKIYGFKTEKDDVSCYDVINNKLVDFNTFHFTDDHLERIKTIIGEKAKYGKIYYQRIPELEMNNGPRQSEERVKYMQLDKIDFKNKTVLDLGCAGGFFARYATKNGACGSLGIDFEDVIGSDTREAAYLISWELEDFKTEFEQHDLREYKPQPTDITFFLSMNYHIRIPSWLGEVTNQVCLFEDNAKGQQDNPEIREQTIKTLRTMFKKVELVGYAKDHGMKPIYHCWK
jgi:hypothetical protein